MSCYGGCPDRQRIGMCCAHLLKHHTKYVVSCCLLQGLGACLLLLTYLRRPSCNGATTLLLLSEMLPVKHTGSYLMKLINTQLMLPISAPA